ncbi:MAG TPA: LON peptidase substrate-binding domain-containing protein [Gemmatimonadota bacterium]|nr:LON peptidase substrate-binding domain-containing protein [Gemmatimonadota bacterium]
MIAPIFPLPNVVFFPHTYLPLHIFEPRYRTMVAEALDGDRLIVMVLAEESRTPGRMATKRGEVAPAIHPIGSVGRIEVAEPLGQGRWNIVLQGLVRVEVGRLKSGPANYFTAELEVLVDALPDLQDPRVAERKAAFLLTARRYGEQVLAGEYPAELFGDAVPYPMLVNRAASLLRVSVHRKQDLLGLGDVEERAAAVERWMTGQLASHAAIERFIGRRPSNPRLN